MQRFLLLFLMLVSGGAFAQQNYQLNIISEESIPKGVIPARVPAFPDSFSAKLFLADIRIELNRQGYLTASFDSLVIGESVIDAHLSLGEQYYWVRLSAGDVDEQLLGAVRFNERRFTEEPFSIRQLTRLQERIISYLENTGYPFAEAGLENVRVEKGEVTAELFVQRNELIVIDTIRIIGEAGISASFLYNYLEVSPGDLYNEELIGTISKKIRDLPFVEEREPFRILFEPGKATIELFLDKRQASRGNFLIGILPNNQQINNRLLVTGEADLHLINPFGTGKTIMPQWQGLQPRSPQFEFQFIYPYFLGLPVGLDGVLNLQKRDTFYLSVGQEVGVQYLFSGSNYFRAFYERSSTSIITVDTFSIKNSRQLPAYLDTRTNYYGLSYFHQNLNYLFNPTRGFAVEVSGSVGTRRVLQNNTITSLTDAVDTAFSFSSLYDSVPAVSNIYRLSYRGEKYFYLGGRNVLMLALQGALMINNDLRENELFRIGGSQLLRGFDEEIVLTSIYNVGTLEYRFLLGENSYFSIFGDVGQVYEQNYSAPFYPVGFGVGLAFETKAGIFAVNYALGRLNDQESVQFKNAKIHFGYINYF